MKGTESGIKEDLQKFLEEGSQIRIHSLTESFQSPLLLFSRPFLMQMQGNKQLQLGLLFLRVQLPPCFGSGSPNFGEVCSTILESKLDHMPRIDIHPLQKNSEAPKNYGHSENFEPGPKIDTRPAFNSRGYF